MGSIVLYMYTSEKTDSHLASHKHNRSPHPRQNPSKDHELYQLPRNTYPGQGQSPVPTDSLKSTDYVYSLETMNSSLQSAKTAQSMDSLKATSTTDQAAQEEYRAATRVK